MTDENTTIAENAAITDAVIPDAATQDAATSDAANRDAADRHAANQAALRDHLWMHMAGHKHLFEGGETPVITRGEGHHIYDDTGREIFDGLAGLFVVQIGHGREEIARTAYEQTKKLGFMPLWSYGHEPAIQLAERIAGHAPR
jgi:adenosylmethionine-8-amino-7-oxononanoate aminotransferase